MRKLRILVDMDDVLNNLLETWVAFLNERHNLTANADCISTWDFSCTYPNLSKNEIEEPLRMSSFWAGLKKKPTSYETLKTMIDDGHEVFVVTAASVYQSLPANIVWLLTNYPYLSWENVVITRRKQLIMGDVLIDDGVHNLVEGSYFKILMDSPNNRQYNAEDNGMVRVYSLKDAYDVIIKELL